MLLLVWPEDVCFFDILKHQSLVLIIEGRNSCEHLVDKDSKSPPVHSLVMACSFEHLRTDVLWGATESV